MTPLVLAALLLLDSASPAPETWLGRLTIGNAVYAVAAENATTADGTVRFSLRLSQGNDARTVAAVLSREGGEAVVNGGPSRPLAPEIAASWRRQLAGGYHLEVSPAEYNCRTTNTQKVCDSRNLVAIDDSLSGRLRLIYNGDRLSGIRFFSLAEWTNPFLEYVTLNLDLQ